MAVFSQASLHARRFLYRQPRLKTNLSMDFILDEKVILGECLSISESGVAGTLSNPMPVGSVGVLTLYHQERSVKIPAVIETPDAEEARIRFASTDPRELEDLRRFIKLLPVKP